MYCLVAAMSHPRAPFAAIVCALGIAGCAPAATPPPAAAPATATRAAAVASPATTASAQCAVWNRELSFAKSVADHDAAAFSEHLHAEAVFLDGDGSVLHGRQAVADGWRPIVEGKKIALSWHPTTVIAGAEPGVALSRGPYLLEDLRPDAKERFRTGTFQSTWVRGADGVWRVFIDGGTPPPVPATAEQAEKIKAELHAPCTAS